MTPMHPTDDDLILHFYGEGRADEEAGLDEHLRTCDSCRAAFAELRETLQLVDAAAVPEPDPGFERVMWARIQPNLATAPRASSSWSVRQWLPLAAAASLAVAAGGFVWWEHRHPAPMATTVAVAPEMPGVVRTSTSTTGRGALAARERVLLTALDQHFQQSEMLLVELMNAPDANGEFAFERATADDLVASGRLYRVTAQQNGDSQLARMLDDLEAVLVEVARSPEKPSKRDIASLRARIDDNGLLFKVRAVSNEIHGRQQQLLKNSTE